MRSYSRKQPEYRFIENVKELCRLCLSSCETMVPIFANNTSGIGLFGLCIRIMLCVGYEVSQDKNLPNNICKDCFEELQRCYMFRKKCVSTYSKLKYHIEALKRQEAKKSLESINNMDVEEKSGKFIITFSDKENADVMYQVKSSTLTSEKNKLHSQPELRCDRREENIEVKSEIKENMLTDDENQLKSQPEASFDQPEENAEVKSEIKENKLTVDENQLKSQPEVSCDQPEVQLKSDNDLSLSAIASKLIELGILVQDDRNENLIIANDCTQFELETLDNRTVFMEIVEEDDTEDKMNLVTLKKTDDKMENPHNDSNIHDLQYIESKTSKNYNVVEKLNRGSNQIKKLIQCEKCNRQFISQSSLTRHYMRHTLERPFQCDICFRSFNQKAVLSRHKLVHQDVRPFKCLNCSKSFTQRLSWIKHQEKHDENRVTVAYYCNFPTCTKSFTHPSGLSRHRMLHFGRKFICDVCHRTFTDRSALMRHIKTCKM